MAEEQRIFIRIDTETKSLDEINKELGKMKRESIAGAGSINKLQARLKDLNIQANEVKIGSKRFKELQQEIIKTDKELRKAQNSLKSTGGFTNQVTQGMINSFRAVGGAIIAAFSVGAIINFGKSALTAFDEQAVAQKALETALGRTSQQLLNQASALQKVSRFGDEAIVQGQAFLAQMGLTEKQILKLTPAILDFAAAKGLDLTQAFDLVSKTASSTTNALSRYGIQIEGAAGSEQRLISITAELNKHFEGQTEATLEGTGHLTQLSNVWGDFLEIVGEGIAITLKPLTSVLKSITEGLNELLKTAETKTLEKFAESNLKTLNSELEKVESNITRTEKTIKNLNNVVDKGSNIILSDMKDKLIDLQGEERALNKLLIEERTRLGETTDEWEKNILSKLKAKDAANKLIEEENKLIEEKKKEISVLEKAQIIDQANINTELKEIDIAEIFRKQIINNNLAVAEGQKFKLEGFEEEKRITELQLELNRNNFDEQAKLRFRLAEIDKQIHESKIKNVQEFLNFSRQGIETIEAFTLASFQRQLAAAGNNEAAQERIRKEFAKKFKAIAIGKAIINTAVAVTESLPNIPLAVAMGILGAVEVGIIASQKFKKGGQVFPSKQGGEIKGGSHSQGGVKFKIGNVVHEAEGGELIVNKNIHQRPDFVDKISQMNYLTGGRRFQGGGIAQAGLNIRNQGADILEINKIVRAIEQIQPIVTVSEINKIQNRVKVIEKNITL